MDGGFGIGFTAKSGQYITIIDLKGAQAGDFVAINQSDPKEGALSSQNKTIFTVIVLWYWRYIS